MAEKFGPHVERLDAIATSPSRRLLAVGGARQLGAGERSAQPAVSAALHLLTLPKGQAAAALAVDGAVHALGFGAGDVLFAGLSTGAVIAWDALLAGSGKESAQASTTVPELARIGDLHDGPVRALALAPELPTQAAKGDDNAPQVLATVGDDGVLRLARWAPDKATLTATAQLRLSSRPLRAVALEATVSGDGYLVAAAGDDGVVRVVSTVALAAAPATPAAKKRGKRGAAAAQKPPEVREMPCGEGGVGALCFTGDGRIAAGCGDGSIQLCYLEGAADAENRARDAAHESMVRGLIMSAALTDDAGRALPQRLFSIAEDGAIKAWQLDTRRKPKTLSLGSAGLVAMAMIAAGRTNKPERRGGTLAIIDDKRRINLLQVSEQAETAASPERIESRLARLRADLGASSTKVRTDAVTALAELPEDEARAMLDRALARDSRPEVRKQAAEAIGKSDRRLSRPALREALGDRDKGVRRAALSALEAIERRTPLAAVRAALSAPHADIRKLAVERLPGLRAQSPLVPGLIAERLSDDQDSVRQAALTALYTLAKSDAAPTDPERATEAAIAPVRVAMQRGPADIRSAALLRMARARYATTAAGMDLLEDALDDADADVRNLAFLISVGSRPQLAAQVCAFDADTRKALAALERGGRFRDPAPAGDGQPALADIGDDTLAPLFSALTCRHPDSALRAARCLGLLGDERATGALLQLSREADVDIRRAVVTALARSAMAMPGDTRLSARLRWLLDDPDTTVRAAAFDALAELGAPEGALAELDLAAQALRSSRQDIRLRALPILVEFGGRGRYARHPASASTAGELLGRALDDEHSKVRVEAFSTLWAWYSDDPRTPLTLAAACRHADVRKRAIDELARLKQRARGHWSDDLLFTLIDDGVAEVGVAAYEVLSGKAERDANNKRGAKATKAAPVRVEVYQRAISATRPEVRAAGCKGAPREAADALRARLVELCRDEHPAVHLAAIEAIDRLVPDDAESFAIAFGSVFYELRVRAAELCGKRRDVRAVGPARALLTIPAHHINRPPDALRQRMARALADVGDQGSIQFLRSLLDDDDPIVREMGARGLATSCRPGDETPLAEALSHPDLPVRSWVAEGLARLGDDRAVPVLAGTLAHDHRPIRVGAIMGFCALGPDGVRGLLQGLDDDDRELQDLVFAVIVARDVALARAEQPPDLLLSALSSSSPEIRFSAARILEARMAGDSLGALAQELVGPRKPDKAADMKRWPKEDERERRLTALIDALASDHPAQRYAAVQVLSLRAQALAFWREAGRLIGPTAAGRPRIPYTSWEDSEAHQPRKRGWLRSLLGRRLQALQRGATDTAQGDAGAEASTATERVLTVLKFAAAPEGRAVPPTALEFVAADAERLVFGTYAGLVRQAPARGAADETHRVRRDSIERLAGLASADPVGRGAVLPVLRRALSDPHHLVRRAGMSALRRVYEEGSLEPLALALEASAADVGRAAVDELVALALADNAEARALVERAIDAPAAEVRAYALTQLPRLFESGSLEPWLLALASRHPDVRLSVVARLLSALEGAAGADLSEAVNARVSEALGRAMESDHDDLRLAAAVALAGRGDARTVDVLAGMLRSDEHSVVTRSTEALVALAHARPQADDVEQVAAAAATAVAARLDDDPDQTADRAALMSALGRIGSPAASDVLLGLLADDDHAIRKQSFSVLLTIARTRDPHRRLLPPKPVGDAGVRRTRYDEPRALHYLDQAARCADAELRRQAAEALRDIDDRGAEALLARLIEDRDESVRVCACESLAFRAEYVAGASIDTLVSTLRAGRRELVLPAAAGLAGRGQPASFQALMLVFKAGEQAERERAVLALGKLGDRRAIAELAPLAGLGDHQLDQLEEEDAALTPAAIEALGCMLPHLRDDDPEHPDERSATRDAVEHFAREGLLPLRQRAMAGLRQAAVAIRRHLADTRTASDDNSDSHIIGFASDLDAAEVSRTRALFERIGADAHDDRSARAFAIEQLGKLADPAAEEMLAETLNARDQRLRRVAMNALEQVFPSTGPAGRENRTRVNMLALASQYRDISAPAASYLAHQGDPAVLVERLAEIDSDDIRRKLRQGLVRRGARPVAAIVTLLGSDHLGARTDAVWLAGAAAEAPGKRADKAKSPDHALTAAERRKLKAAITDALSAAPQAWRDARASLAAPGQATGDSGAQPGQRRLALASELWQACLWAGTRLDTDSLAVARESLQPEPSGPTPAAVRREALYFIASHGDSASLDAIKPMLSDPDPSVRAAAGAAVAALAPDRARETLSELAVADVAALAPLASAALSENDEHNRALIEDDSSRRLVLPVVLGQKRTATLSAIAKPGGAPGAPGVKDPARLVAIASLGRLGGDDAAASLHTIFADESETDSVRAAAYRALRRLQRRAERTARFAEEESR